MFHLASAVIPFFFCLSDPLKLMALPLQLIIILPSVCQDVMLDALLLVCGSTDAGKHQGAQLCYITDESWSL